MAKNDFFMLTSGKEPAMFPAQPTQRKWKYKRVREPQKKPVKRVTVCALVQGQDLQNSRIAPFLGTRHQLSGFYVYFEGTLYATNTSCSLYLMYPHMCCSK